jgi:hypothetical protein
MREATLRRVDALHLTDPKFAGAVGSDLQTSGLERGPAHVYIKSYHGIVKETEIVNGIAFNHLVSVSCTSTSKYIILD